MAFHSRARRGRASPAAWAHGTAVAPAEHQDTIERAAPMSFFTPLLPYNHSQKETLAVGEKSKDVL